MREEGGGSKGVRPPRGWLSAVRRLGAMARSIRGRSPLSIARSGLRMARRWAWSTDAMIIYQLDRTDWDASSAAEEAEGPPIRTDALEDFRHYTGSNPYLTKEQLLAEAARRLAAGQHCDTMVENGVLAHYGWIEVNPERIHFTQVDFTYQVPPNTAAIYENYTEPAFRGRGLYRRAIAYRMRFAFGLGVDRLTGAVLETNLPSRRGTEAAGYRAVARIVRTRRFGRSRSWQESV